MTRKKRPYELRKVIAGTNAQETGEIMKGFTITTKGDGITPDSTKTFFYTINEAQSVEDTGGEDVV